MKLDVMLDARKTYAGASSSGCAGRPIVTSFPNFATSLAGFADGLSGVHTGPGATALTRIPLSASICASVFVNA